MWINLLLRPNFFVLIFNSWIVDVCHLNFSNTKKQTTEREFVVKTFKTSIDISNR